MLVFLPISGPITMEDVLTVVPFRNGIDIISLKGEHLLATLEHSVSLYLPDAPEGRFLQVSGDKNNSQHVP